MDVNPQPPPLPLLTFTSSSASSSSSSSSSTPLTPLDFLALGSDADIGGLSTAQLTPVPAQQQQDHVAFNGTLSTAVPPQFAGRIRTGYAAFRNRSRPTLFGEDTWDLELFSHLKVEVAYRGWEGWRDKWVVNLQTDGPVKSDLFQHRLDLPPSPLSTASRAPLDPLHATGLQFHTLYLPLSSFVLTNSGQTAATQIGMMRQRVRTVGFALLGGGRADSAPSPTAAAEVEKNRRVGAGGWGTPGAGEAVDPELEALMASDQPAQAQRRFFPRSPAAASGYHRVGATAAPPAEEEGADDAALEHTGPQTGYYELALRSVEAVRYDPEVDE
ncbi:hypothetical protein VHUM_04231 [Vanrija humicola]|uniref:NADH:ubiquinone oxidoreductase intermediate-associated protein 30 domain-containing protein n=1 Tax=Vanrija humicola TaxID=5417 RepID=A0A7D8UYP5_VANHU|nr:hypothetical protein VHUM_04231 [Vanrija humicola]